MLHPDPSDLSRPWVRALGTALTQPYIEIINATSENRDLGQYTIEDSSSTVRLPKVTLTPKQIVLLWADGHTEQGVLHLGLKVNAQGETLTLRRRNGTVGDKVEVPPLAEHHAYERMPDAVGPFADCGCIGRVYRGHAVGRRGYAPQQRQLGSPFHIHSRSDRPAISFGPLRAGRLKKFDDAWTVFSDVTGLLCGTAPRGRSHALGSSTRQEAPSGWCDFR